jgi:GT2 family glycosyltransferase
VATLKVHAILACHNRREITVGAVLSAAAAARVAAVDIDFTVFDDGSTDGTAAALQELDEQISIIAGDGSAYWAMSMARSESRVLATEHADGDFLLWLNDDVVLDASSLGTLASVAETHQGAVVVGATREPATGVLAYAGFRQSGWHPLSFEVVEPQLEPTNVDTFNGNVVLVPTSVARRLGGIDGLFSHALADIDYGLRCKRLGVPVVLASGTIGTCARNLDSPTISLMAEWRRYTGVKGGGNFRSVRHFVLRHAPRKWPAAVMVSYFLWWARRLRSLAVRRGRAV